MRSDAIDELAKLGSGQVWKEAEQIILSLEERRGREYAQSTRPNKIQEIVAAIASLVRKLIEAYDHGTAPPAVPEQAIKEHEGKRYGYEYAIFKGRLDPSVPAPEKPAALTNYEHDLRRWAEGVRDSAQSQGVYWFASPAFDGLVEQVATRFLASTRRAPTERRPRRVSTQPLEHISLEGEYDWPFERPTNALTKDDVRRALPQLDLVFLDEVGLQARERETESNTHRDLVEKMATGLLRLGWSTYLGGAGVRGVMAMADLVAFDGATHLFVECLTKSAIKKFRKHETKRELCERVPFLFVGELPEEFHSTLPSECWAIAYPASPRTQAGIWVPPHFRTAPSAPVEIRVLAKRGRVKTSLSFEATGLRLQEDISGFLFTALTELLRRRQSDWREVRFPRVPVGCVPFLSHGQSGTVMELESGTDRLKLLLGRLPLSAELRGEVESLQRLFAQLNEIGLSISLSGPIR
ncbi:MAG: hypothetical protein Q8L14_10225 [Myxococcales bacterium]|nr:hypothetical protein [Myxococcales bacterium]